MGSKTLGHPAYLSFNFRNTTVEAALHIPCSQERCIANWLSTESKRSWLVQHDLAVVLCREDGSLMGRFCAFILVGLSWAFIDNRFNRPPTRTIFHPHHQLYTTTAGNVVFSEVLTLPNGSSKGCG